MNVKVLIYYRQRFTYTSLDSDSFFHIVSDERLYSLQYKYNRSHRVERNDKCVLPVFKGTFHPSFLFSLHMPIFVYFEFPHTNLFTYYIRLLLNTTVIMLICWIIIRIKNQYENLILYRCIRRSTALYPFCTM